MAKTDGYEVPEGLFHHEEYLWARVEDGEARIGMTDYAQKQLREIVYAELPNEDDVITKGEPFGTVESVKAVSDVIAPLSGTIEAVNEEIDSKPELLKEDPYGEAWILLVTPTDLDASSFLEGVWGNPRSRHFVLSNWFMGNSLRNLIFELRVEFGDRQYRHLTLDLDGLFL